MARSARSAYDVRVLGLEGDETGNETARTLLLGAVEWMLDSLPSGVSRVGVEIISVETDDVLVRWTESPVDADLLRRKIETDLDQMDAETFASEWGLAAR